MIGTRLGAKSSFVGAAVGSAADDESGGGAPPPPDPMAGVTRDSTSLKYYPATNAEWTIAMAAAGLGTGNPTAIYNCQDVSGSLIDANAALSLTTITGVPTYSQAVAGHTRLGVGFVDGAGTSFRRAIGAGPNPLTTSSIWMWVADITVAAATRAFASASVAAAADVTAIILSTPKVRVRESNVSVDGASNPLTASTQPYVLQHDLAGSRSRLFTRQEKVSGTFSLVTADGLKGLGAVTTTCPTAKVCYGCMFQGTAAELTDAQVKTLLTTLGWSIPWS